MEIGKMEKLFMWKHPFCIFLILFISNMHVLFCHPVSLYEPTHYQWPVLFTIITMIRALKICYMLSIIKRIWGTEIPVLLSEGFQSVKWLRH